MKVGVIIPVKNAKKTIGRALRSVFDQDKGHKIIPYIMDDYSEDGSSQEIDKFIKKKNRFSSGEPCGQSLVRNFLISKALEDKCDYIAFLDADDFWAKNHINISLRELNTKLADIVYNTPEFRNEKNEYVEPVNIPIPNFFIGKQLEHNNFIWISSVVAKAKVFKENNFDSELDSIEDWDMWYRLYKQDYKFFKHEYLTTYYQVSSEGQAKNGKYKLDALRRKHNFTLHDLNLHLACGEDYQENFINIDLYPLPTAKIDAKFDVKQIPYDDCTIDCIRALHILEHFSFHEGQKVLEEWYRVLKPEGRLIIEVPDFLATCIDFVNGDNDTRINLYGHFFAFPDLPGQVHKFMFTEDQLMCQLGWAGFKRMQRVQPISNYVMPHTVHRFLTVEAYK
jgi:hypothetical protein